MQKSYLLITGIYLLLSMSIKAIEDTDSTVNTELDKGPQLVSPSSTTFVIRAAFRERTPLRFEPNGKAATVEEKLAPVAFDPERVQPGDIIFARVPGLFFKYMHPRIQNPYILVTHGDVDDGFKEEHVPYLKEKKLIAWFGIHPGTQPHPKFFPLPLGVIGLGTFYERRTEMHQYFAKLRNETVKSRLLGMNFTERTHRERKIVKELFEDKPFCHKFDETLPTMDYLKEMASCKFILSPRGAGIDCYRTWEAILVGCIPIVRSSQLNSLYKDLPILVVDDWQEVTEEFLEKKYKEMTAQPYSLDKLYFEYWYNRIEIVQHLFLTKCHPHRILGMQFTRSVTYDEHFSKQLHELSTLWKPSSLGIAFL
jgi:hypothetical protein